MKLSIGNQLLLWNSSARHRWPTFNRKLSFLYLVSCARRSIHSCPLFYIFWLLRKRGHFHPELIPYYFFFRIFVSKLILFFFDSRLIIIHWLRKLSPNRDDLRNYILYSCNHFLLINYQYPYCSSRVSIFLYIIFENVSIETSLRISL